jgi:hypothetical protein
MTEQRPCSCGGSNDNCMRCNRRGFIEAGESASSGGYFPARHTRRKKRKNKVNVRQMLGSSNLPTPSSVESSGQKTAKCLLCGFKGLTDDFTRHFALLHGTRGQQREQRNMKTCPLCDCFVREDRLQKHISGRCPSRASDNLILRSRRRTTVSIKDIQLFVKCPKCGINVASDQFTKHRALAHGRIGQNSRQPS